MVKLTYKGRASNLISSLERAVHVKDIDAAIIPKILHETAEYNDRESFKGIVDNFVSLAQRDPENKDMGTERLALSYIEFLCKGMDIGFTTVGYGLGSEIPIGKTQSLFRDLYKDVLENYEDGDIWIKY